MSDGGGRGRRHAECRLAVAVASGFREVEPTGIEPVTSCLQSRAGFRVSR